MCKQERYTEANGWEVCSSTEPAGKEHPEPTFIRGTIQGKVTDNSTDMATVKALEGVDDDEVESD